MFDVKNKKTNRLFTVYSVERLECGITLFLIYDKVYGWGWHKANDYIPTANYILDAGWENCKRKDDKDERE